MFLIWVMSFLPLSLRDLVSRQATSVSCWPCVQPSINVDNMNKYDIWTAWRKRDMNDEWQKFQLNTVKSGPPFQITKDSKGENCAFKDPS